MWRRGTITVTTLAIALVAAGGIGLALATAPPRETSVSQPTDARHTAPLDSSAAPSAAPQAGTASPRPTNSPTAGAQPTDSAVPRAQEGGVSTPLPVATLPPAPPVARILSGPAPENGDAVGELATGFPAGIPVAPHSTIGASSLSSEGKKVQVTLTATSGMSEIDLLQFYRVAFAKFGMLDTPSPSGPGSTSLQFTREDDSITLAVTTGDSGVEYILFASLTAHDPAGN